MATHHPAALLKPRSVGGHGCTLPGGAREHTRSQHPPTPSLKPARTHTRLPPAGAQSRHVLAALHKAVCVLHPLLCSCLLIPEGMCTPHRGCPWITWPEGDRAGTPGFHKTLTVGKTGADPRHCTNSRPKHLPVKNVYIYLSCSFNLRNRFQVSHTSRSYGGNPRKCKQGNNTLVNTLGPDR